MVTQPNLAVVAGLEPRIVWELFAGLAAVPRPSKKEAAAQAWVRAWAKEHGLKCRQDEPGNIVVEVPATAGHAQAPVTILQAHLDMVCEKNAGTQHDFDHDPIRLVRGTDERGAPLIHAAGTTLGADNGLGVCLAMAAAITPGVQRPPLELLFTFDEEAGMTGARALKPDFLRGRRLLNLDSEEDDALYIGCAGGLDTTIKWRLPLATVPAGASGWQVTVTGLRGGHSGGDIHENRGNALKLLTRVLRGPQMDGVQLAALSGGSKRNAIPREAAATIAGSAALGDHVEAAAAAVQDEVRRYRHEPDCTINVEVVSVPQAASPVETQRLLAALAAVPSGVLAVVPEIPGLVETSNNLSTAESRVEQGLLEVALGCLSRSSLQAALREIGRQLAAIASLAGATAVQGGEYPGWMPNASSPLLATCRAIFQERFGKEPKVAAIHAGLECGIIAGQMPDMDMVSFGPRIEGAHSPTERVWVMGVQRSWEYLQAVLAALAQG